MNPSTFVIKEFRFDTGDVLFGVFDEDRDRQVWGPAFTTFCKREDAEAIAERLRHGETGILDVSLRTPDGKA